ncbi:MAG: triphosphoribosyl-dephospho-CoA synthase CitG [Marinisporobacter sp.]|nr:triphosphoribosyl-dephospho-CoA synthase CitG [Marinisporobacter sp.]
MIKYNEFCKCVSEIAVKALLFEVSATPKPGLVDRYNSGAHGDMDFYTFMSSSAALGHTFYQCALAAGKYEEVNYDNILAYIRPIGIEGEKRMLKATGGVNTHKGLIFSLGIIAAVAGMAYIESPRTNIDSLEICSRVISVTKGISQKELVQNKKKKEFTYGEYLYKKYGVKGIRGEVESGFATVREYGLPILISLMKNRNLNDVLVQVLLHLMMYTEDSNVLGRHDLSTLDYVKINAKQALSLGGIFTAEGRKKVMDMDKDFIEKNISPGGAADLLAVTLMLYFLGS